MQLSTTFRHMDASSAVRDYAADRLDKIRKYFNKDPISAHAVFSVRYPLPLLTSIGKLRNVRRS